MGRRSVPSAPRSPPSAPRSPLADLDDKLHDAVHLASFEADVGAEDGAHVVRQKLAVVDMPRVAGDALQETLVVAGHVRHHDAHASASRPFKDPFIHADIVGRCALEGQNRMARPARPRGSRHAHDRQMVGDYQTPSHYQR